MATLLPLEDLHAMRPTLSDPHTSTESQYPASPLNPDAKFPVAPLLRALHATDPGALRIRRWDICLPEHSLSEAARLSDMSVDVVDIDIVSDIAEVLLCMMFCWARLIVGDKSFTNGKDSGIAGAGGSGNVGIGGGGEVKPTSWPLNGGGDGESPRPGERGDISEPSGLVIMTS
jgi:hypothetical protein